MNRKQKLDLLNLINHAHDLICPCEQGIVHTHEIIEEINPELKKCRSTTTAQDGDVIDGFGPGELDALFAEDGGEEKPTTEG